MLPSLLLAGISLLSAVSAAVIPSHDTHDHDHDHVSQRLLPDQWYHADDHPAHALFRRQAGTPPDPSAFPQVGTPAWAAAYPASTPDSNAMPQSWKDALNNAVQAGKIPNYPPARQSSPNANPTYGSLNPSGPQVCSASYGCRIAGQVWDAPQGVIGISFDDGPLPPSDTLYAFLQQNQVRATHFYIGVNIVQFWKEFNIAFANQNDIAVHTWTHPHMTALSNADVVAQLGWTLQPSPKKYLVSRLSYGTKTLEIGPLVNPEGPILKRSKPTSKDGYQLDGQGAYQNAKDDTTPPTLVALTAGGNGGAGTRPFHFEHKRPAQRDEQQQQQPLFQPSA
ncbi:hypothetical protein EDB89DRAFT_2224651 [Lactarius sanguifluus]|nr:hypothetical protein EDB89DRAFT_2224651 [Lactarius sanguifluus]